MMMGLELLLLPLLLIPVVLIGAVAYALGWRPQFNQNTPAQTDQNSLEILKARYARGEISREDFDRMRRDLEV